MGKNDTEKNENSSGKVPAAIEILKRAENWFKGNF